MTEISASLASGSISAVMTLGPILQGPDCGSVCSASSDMDGGSDAGN
jgi:hypothetical protein